MPIANLIVSDQCVATHEANLDALWAEESGMSPDDISINICRGCEQIGNRYSIMATLYLPSLWAEERIGAIQVGLAQALSRYFGIDINTIHILCQIVESGRVVENGKILSWT